MLQRQVKSNVKSVFAIVARRAKFLIIHKWLTVALLLACALVGGFYSLYKQRQLIVHFEQVKNRSVVLGQIQPSWLDDFVHFCLDGVVPANSWHYVECLWPIEELRLLDTPITDRDMAIVERIGPQLKSLYVSSKIISPRGFQSLRYCPNLETLSLSNTAIDNEGLQRLQGLSRLRSLSLAKTRLSKLDVLGTFPELTWLNLNGTTVSRSMLGSLSRVVQLEDLLLNNSTVEDGSIEVLKDCHHLKRIGLSNTQISNRSVGLILGWKSLEQIELDGTEIDCSGIAELNSHRSLRIIKLDSRQVCLPASSRLSRMERLTKILLVSHNGNDDTQAASRILLQTLPKVQIKVILNSRD